MRIILGSKSPRRQELMNLLGYDYIVDYPRDAEIIGFYNGASDYVRKASTRKAREISRRHPDSVVVGADTVVAVHNNILGKPKDIDDARRMLLMISKNTHIVLTGVAIFYKRKRIVFVEKTKVFVDEIPGGDLEDYISTAEPYDKAGGYAIQGTFGKYINRIEGDYYNVVGLPINKLYRNIEKIKNEW